MRGLLAFVAGAILLVAALAIMAPASLLDRRVADLTGGRLRIAATAGTVWKGSGELALLPDGVRIPIAWRLEPMPLLRGGLAGALTVGDATRPATFSVEREDFTVHDFAIALPATSVLRAAGVPDALTNAGGTLLLDVTDLARSGDRLEARADLKWTDAALPAALTGARIALGDLRLAAAGSGSEVPATLSNSGGEVDIAGSLLFSTRGKVQIDARVKPRPELPADRREAIAATLSSIGRADGAGGYRIVWPLIVR
ncbi:MAG TPA: type II secretion system protein N [Casimicrobiaceae bacterium]|nr:type II secretion system protein N [Casimicrobiaceae bacterium]